MRLEATNKNLCPQPLTGRVKEFRNLHNDGQICAPLCSVHTIPQFSLSLSVYISLLLNPGLLVFISRLFLISPINSGRNSIPF